MDFQNEVNDIKNRLDTNVLEMERLKAITKEILDDDKPQQLNVNFFLKNYYVVVCEFLFNNRDLLYEESSKTNKPTNFVKEWTTFAKSKFGKVELIEKQGKEIIPVIVLPSLFTSPEMFNRNIEHFANNITEFHSYIENGYNNKIQGFFRTNIEPTLSKIENKSLDNRRKWISALSYLRTKYNIKDNYDEFFSEVSSNKEITDITNIETMEDLGFC